MKAPLFNHTADDGVLRIHFDSIREIVELALADGVANHADNLLKIDDRLNAMGGEGGEPGSRSGRFFNGYTRETLEAAIANPSADLIFEVEEIKNDLDLGTPAPIGRRRRVAHRLEMGDELDETAWVQRQTDGWSESRHEPTIKRVVRIGVNLSVHCGQEPSELLYRGAAAIALADKLIDQGFSVEIVAFQSTSGGTNGPCCDRVATIIVKRPDAPLDIGAASFALSEIAFFRAIVMSASARCLAADLPGGWGCSKELPSNDREGFDVIIDTDIATRAAALALVRRYATAVTHKG